MNSFKTISFLKRLNFPITKKETKTTKGNSMKLFVLAGLLAATQAFSATFLECDSFTLPLASPTVLTNGCGTRTETQTHGPVPLQYIYEYCVERGIYTVNGMIHVQDSSGNWQHLRNFSTESGECTVIRSIPGTCTQSGQGGHGVPRCPRMGHGK